MSRANNLPEGPGSSCPSGPKRDRHVAVGTPPRPQATPFMDERQLVYAYAGLGLSQPSGRVILHVIVLVPGIESALDHGTAGLSSPPRPDFLSHSL